MSDIISTAKNERNIETVTQEIQFIKKQAEGFMLQSAIEIGRRLQEAKQMVPHGEWGAYLQEQVEFSQSTANNMMKIAEEYGDKQVSFFGVSANSQALGNLSYTKALRLLSIPEEERETFVETHDVENMSTRELEKAIRERDDAKAALETASKQSADMEAERDALREQLAAVEQKAADAKAAEKKAKDKVKELKNNPQIPNDVMDRIRSEAETAAAEKAEKEKETALADAKAAEDAARANAEKAQREAAELAEKLAAMEKQVRAANPKVTEFGTLFRQVQGTYTDMMRVLSEIDPDTAERLREAVAKMLDGWKGAL